MLSAQEVTDRAPTASTACVTTADGGEYGASAVLLAPGSTYRRLGVPGEDDFIGAGVHFCATCDGPFYRGQEVLVIGGGNSAGEESIFLTRFASKVTIAGARPGADRQQDRAQDKALANPKIEVLLNTEVVEFQGEGKLERRRHARQRRPARPRRLTRRRVRLHRPLAQQRLPAPNTIKRDRRRLRRHQPDAGDQRAGHLRGRRRPRRAAPSRPPAPPARAPPPR